VYFNKSNIPPLRSQPKLDNNKYKKRRKKRNGPRKKKGGGKKWQSLE
jgi:hypothetical protein